jgi:hypothetical protein
MPEAAMRTLKLIVVWFARGAIAITVLLYAVLIRPWHMRWGASSEEVQMRLEGDRMIARGAIVSTRALDIDAPPDEVWRWMLQLGQGRGGFYSYEWLENLFAADMRNAELLEPRLLKLDVGDSISFQADGPATVVTLVEPERALVLGDGWTLALRRIDEGRTRLIVRYPFDTHGRSLDALYYYTVFEPAHFVMESGMMLGIRERAERSFAQSRRASGLAAGVRP